MQAKPYMAEDVIKQVKDSKSVKDLVDGGKRNFDSLLEKTGLEKVAVETIVAGQQERANWLEMMAFLQDAIPVPTARTFMPTRQSPTLWGIWTPTVKNMWAFPTNFASVEP